MVESQSSTLANGTDPSKIMIAAIALRAPEQQDGDISNLKKLRFIWHCRTNAISEGAFYAAIRGEPEGCPPVLAFDAPPCPGRGKGVASRPASPVSA